MSVRRRRKTLQPRATPWVGYSIIPKGPTDRDQKTGFRAQRAGSSRGVRGGAFNNNANNLAASDRNNNPTNENNNIGFSVASS